MLIKTYSRAYAESLAPLGASVIAVRGGFLILIKGE